MLKFIEGFDQFQGNADASLLSALNSAGYQVSGGLAMVPGRKTNSYALEIQVSPGSAGEVWSNRTNSIKQDMFAISTSPSGRSIAVGNAGVAMTSTDDSTWLPLIIGVTVNMKDIKCGESGTWIGVGDDSTVVRSTDGRNFTRITLPLAGLSLKAVTDGGGKWVAVGANGSAGAILLSLDDGLTWSPAAQQGTAPHLSIGYGNATWLVGGVNGQLLKSSDGNAYTNEAYGTAANINAIAFGDNTWLATDNLNLRKSTNNGLSWSNAATEIITSGQLRTIAYAAGRWIVAGDNAKLLYTTDLSTSWTTAVLTGASGQINDVSASSGAQVGWRMVGQRISAGGVDMAMLYVSLAPPNAVTRRYSTSSPRLVIGFAHRSSVRGRIASIVNLLNMDWPGPVVILGQAGTVVPARDVWYYYELVIDRTSNQVQLYINNVLDITVALPAAGATMQNFDFSYVAENGAVTRLDDMYFLDSDSTGGATLVDRIGPIQIPTRMPDADVLTQWTAASAGPHWAQVGILPASEESYVRSATSGAQDLFSSATALPAEAGTPQAPIIAVGLTVLAQKSDIDARQLGLAVGQGGTQKVVVDTALNIVPEYSYAIFETAPGDVPWTPSNVTATPFGVIVKP